MKKPWFSAKRYGWGWGLPATWQGWLIFVAYLVFISFDAFRVSYKYHHVLSGFLVTYISHILIASGFLFLIVYRTSEKPTWKWGNKKEKLR